MPAECRDPRWSPGDLHRFPRPKQLMCLLQSQTIPNHVKFSIWKCYQIWKFSKIPNHSREVPKRDCSLAAHISISQHNSTLRAMTTPLVAFVRCAASALCVVFSFSSVYSTRFQFKNSKNTNSQQIKRLDSEAPSVLPGVSLGIIGNTN